MTRLFSAIALLVSVFLADAGAAEKKNVLWIYLEDVSGWFSCYGDTIIETPVTSMTRGS